MRKTLNLRDTLLLIAREIKIRSMMCNYSYDGRSLCNGLFKEMEKSSFSSFT